MGFADAADAERFLSRLADASDRSGGVLRAWGDGVGPGDVLADLVRMSVGNPERTRAVVRLALARDAFAVDELVDVVPDAGLAPLAAGAVDALRDGADVWTSPATWVVARVAQQDPTAMGPHREALLDLVWRDPPTTPWWLWPPEWSWRDAPDEDLEPLAGLLDDPDPNLRTVAWSCLVASRTETGLALAQEARGTRVPDDDDAATRLLMAAQDPDVPGRSLVAVPTPYLVDLPKPYYRSGAKPPIHVAPGTGPSLPPIAATGVFGGLLPDQCPSCGSPLQSIVDVALPEGPQPPPVITCTACVGLADEVVYMDHADDLPPTDRPEPEGEPGERADLPETTALLRPAPPRSALPTVEWSSTQVLDRLGGEPAWNGAPEYPGCPRCERRMPFLLQLTSPDLRDGPNPSWEEARFSWGDTGMLWAFWCEPCRVTATYVPFPDVGEPVDDDDV